MTEMAHCQFRNSSNQKCYLVEYHVGPHQTGPVNMELSRPSLNRSHDVADYQIDQMAKEIEYLRQQIADYRIIIDKIEAILLDNSIMKNKLKAIYKVIKGNDI